MGHLRIIAGSLRGRRIAVPDQGVRPTPDRAREGLFSILAPRLDRARVLDLYAGSGALGFEALSRGARRAVFVERDPRVADALRVQSERLGLGDRTRVLVGEADAYLTRGLVTGPFDLILADPPYDRPPSRPALAAAVGLLAPDGLLAVERDARSPVAEPGIGGLLRTVRYGRTAFDFLVPGAG